MKSPLHEELHAILETQARLRQSLFELDLRIDRVRRQIEAPRAEPAAAEPPPLPVQQFHPAVAPAPVSGPRMEPRPVSAPAPPQPQPEPAAAQSGESLEFQLGTVWLPRIGIVILLTGLVFLGNFGYRTLVHHIGPAGKLALLYAAAASLTGIGLWIARRGESMRNYARVLIAGGAATAYYSTFAAHFVERLRVIESPLAGGALLLAVAAAIVWLADRQRSQNLALLAILLSYYTSAINPIGAFTLFSSLLLTASGLFFLLRHRWSAISYASLIGTYGSYAFWRFHIAIQQGGPAPATEGFLFLLGYWLLFTATVFLGKGDVLPPSRRTAFLTLNNSAFFALGGHHVLVHNVHWFCAYALAFGVTLLGLAALASRRRAEDRSMDGAYLAQGLALVTVGFAAKLTGYQLALTLAAQSAVLVTCSRWRQAWLYQMAATAAAAGACGLALNEIFHRPEMVLPLGSAVAAVLLFDAWWLKKQRGELAALETSPCAALFAFLSLLLVGTMIWQKVPAPWQGGGFAIAAVVCTASLYLLRLPEVVYIGQSYMAVAVGLWLDRHWERLGVVESWWHPLPVIGAALGLGHWWQRQRSLKVSDAPAVQITFALGAVLVGLRWMNISFEGDSWIAATALAALGSVLYAAVSRDWAVALVGQLFAVFSVFAFFSGLLLGHPAWSATLVPVLSLGAISVLASKVQAPGWTAVAPVALGYRLASTVLLCAWGIEYVPVHWRMAFFIGLGALQLLVGSVWSNRERAWSGIALELLGLLVFAIYSRVAVTWPELLTILLVPASVRLAVLVAASAPSAEAPALKAKNLLLSAATVAAWLWVTRSSLQHAHSNLTISWSVLALLVLTAGFALRERVLRLGGLVVLGLALARIVLVDVWKLEALYTIFSFMVLGVVLLLLGFAYNRFAEQIRRWL